MKILKNLRSLLAISFLLASTASVNAVEPPIQLSLLDIDMVWDYAPHNAFTDLIRYEDQWYMAFREGNTHAVSGDGKVRVIRSSDAVNWSSVALLDYGSVWDMRDAKLNILPDGRLMLNTAAAPMNTTTSHRQSLAWFTGDGTNWSNGPYPVGQWDWWMWGVTVHPDGTIYSVGYGDISTHPRTTRLYSSTNGTSYSTIVPTLTSEDETGETALLFREDGSAVALVRDNSSDQNQSFVGTSTSASGYTDWTFHQVAERIGGPELIQLPDGNLLAASRLLDMSDDSYYTAISWLVPETGQMTELLRLPSGGDNSYPGMVWKDDKLWVSYYSSHEGSAKIYLAQVDVEASVPFVPNPYGTVEFQEGSKPNISYEASAVGIRTDIPCDEGSEYVIVGETDDHGKSLRGVFSFDLSVLPENAHVIDASFTLTADRNDTTTGTVDDDFTLSLHQLDDSFIESEVDWTQKSNGNNWNNYGGDFLATPLASLQANPYRLLSEGPTYTWESTAEFLKAVQEVLDAGGSLDMLLYTPDGEAQGDRVVFYFCSDDTGDPSDSPLLSITYTVVDGDANGDGVVDGSDATLLANNWQYGSDMSNPDATWSMGDFNGDGVVDGSDATILANNWQYDVNSPANCVPEPSTLALLLTTLLTAGTCVCLNKRRQ